jgi:putative membrane protein
MIERYADHSANERTFLAWVRTVIAIEGFGIVAARLGDGCRRGAGRSRRFLRPVRWSSASPLPGCAAFARGSTSAETVEDAAIPADALLLLVIFALFGLIGVFALQVG